MIMSLELKLFIIQFSIYIYYPYNLKMEKSKIVHIVYGSETGTSYDLAK
jgi:hypothetical protein